MDVALSSLVKEGFIRRVIPGIYERPRMNTLLGTRAAPDLYSVAKALARKFSWRIHPSGNTALNLLGLSTQIPGRMIFHSDGPSRKYTIGNRDIEFKHTSLNELVFRLPESNPILWHQPPGQSRRRFLGRRAAGKRQGGCKKQENKLFHSVVFENCTVKSSFPTSMTRKPDWPRPRGFPTGPAAYIRMPSHSV